ncbi:MAG TPA: hypothetical protein VMD59_19230 [Acidimicrobiales bacterium]|nr:hypothetical protein [Acidimicrobiales bacterium]
MSATHATPRRASDFGRVRYLLGGRMAELDVLTSIEWQAGIEERGLEDCGTVLVPHAACNPVTGVIALDSLIDVAGEAAARGAGRVVLLLDRTTAASATFGLAAVAHS